MPWEMGCRTGRRLARLTVPICTIHRHLVSSTEIHARSAPFQEHARTYAEVGKGKMPYATKLFGHPVAGFLRSSWLRYQCETGRAPSLPVRFHQKVPLREEIGIHTKWMLIWSTWIALSLQMVCSPATPMAQSPNKPLRPGQPRVLTFLELASYVQLPVSGLRIGNGRSDDCACRHLATLSPTWQHDDRPAGLVGKVIEKSQYI